MSIHVIINPETQARLAAQRRNSTVASIIIGLLLTALLAMVFWLIGIKFFKHEVEPMVVYAEQEIQEEVVEKEKVTNSVKKTPSSPSSSAVQVITAQAVTNFSVPTPDIPVEKLSVDFGESDGFGAGWGGAGGGFGAGGGAGSFSFMGSKMKGERVCFIIDFSSSMRGKRVALLRDELGKTVSELPDGVEYQIIFFSGPAWTAGATLKKGRSTATVTIDNESYKWEAKSRSNWVRVGKKQPVKWIKSTKENREESVRIVRESPLDSGTSWNGPMEMAMEMDPKPDLIVFLTDGASGGDSFAKAVRLGKMAKAKDIKVNTVALMEPSMRAAMTELSRLTGGEFSLVDENGKKTKQDIQARGGIKQAK